MKPQTKRGRFRVVVIVEDQTAMEFYSDAAEFDESPDASVPDLVREHLRTLAISASEGAKANGIGRRP